MVSIIVFLIFALTAIAITYKTYVGYGDFSWYTKLITISILVIGWSGPFIAYYLRRLEYNKFLVMVSDVLYILFAFVCLVMIISFLRDTLWMLVTLIRRLPATTMDNPVILNKLNLATLLLCALLCGYGIYEGIKTPNIVTHEIASAKIKKPTKVVMMTDTHIDVSVPASKVKKMVELVNSLKPDVIVMVGDIIDNTPKKIYKQLKELQKLKAPEGRFVTLGNHEFYAGALVWGMTFSQLGFDFQNGTGTKIADTGLYIAGIPDIPSAKFKKMPIKVNNALYNADKEDYVVLLTHTPQIAEGVTAENVDLQLSGHTHGGQIFPFHYLVKTANDGVLAGFYNKEGVNMYVSRGTGYWGPAMRLFAPSEITVFNFVPEQKHAK